MKLEPHVKVIPFVFSPYVKLSHAKGFLFINWIFLRPEIYHDLKSKNPDPYNVAILIHEQTHLKRKQEVGHIIFWGRYILTRKGRLNEELLAYGAQMKYLKQQGIPYDISSVAKALSGWVYWWCSDYQDAYEQLQKIWLNA